MKALCLFLPGVNIALLAASWMPYQFWSSSVCRNSFDLCEYPLALGLGVVVWIGLFVAAQEIG